MLEIQRLKYIAYFLPSVNDLDTNHELNKVTYMLENACIYTHRSSRGRQSVPEGPPGPQGRGIGRKASSTKF